MPASPEFADQHLDAPLRDAKQFLQADIGRPRNRPAAFLPILRLRLAHQKTDQALRQCGQAEIGQGLLERRQYLEWLCRAARQSGKGGRPCRSRRAS